VPLTLHVGGLRNAPNPNAVHYPGQIDIGWYNQFAGVPEPEIDAMVRGNASRIFGITV
jgi:hypothetical protein